MPSRKIISVLILTSALVTGVILASGEKQIAPKTSGGNFVNIVSESNKNELLNNNNWKQDLAALPMATPAETNASSTETLTEQVSRSLVSNYLALKQSGNLDSASAQNLVNQTVNYIESPETKKFTSADLIVSPDNGQEAVRRYGTDLGIIFKINNTSSINEIELFSEILQTRNESRVVELQEVSLVYKQVAASLMKLNVPSSYVEFHLEMTNGIQEIASSVDNMAFIFSDPIRSMQGIGGYQTGYLSFINAANKIRVKIRADGVIYKQGESGYYFYYGI